MPDQPTTLTELIQGALDTGLTLRQLAERATDPRSGETVSKDTINKIVLGRVTRMPIEEHVRGIAAALRLPYEQVRQAAIAQWLPAEEERSAEQLRLELLRARNRLDELNAEREEIMRLEQKLAQDERLKSA